MTRPTGLIAAVPNLLSALRLVLAGAFPFVPPSWRLPVVLIGGLSDWLDGFVARRFHAQSTLGGLLDAIADKTFALSVLFTLAAASVIAPWQVGVVVLRDLAVLGICVYFALGGRWKAFTGMPSRWAGKITTALLFLWLAAVLAHLPPPVTLPLFAALALFSAAAAADYLLQFARALRRLRP